MSAADRAAPEVAVVGSANLDLVVRVPRRPAGGETLLGADPLRLPGGKGANQAVAAARCGAAVEFTGCLGDDAEGRFLRERLAEAGVGTAGVAAGERPTGTALILLTPDGENSIVVSPGANAELDAARADRASDAWLGARVVVLNFEIPLETVAHVAARASDAGSRVLINAAPAAGLGAATLAVCDPLVVNEHEARGVLAAVEIAGEAAALSTSAPASAPAPASAVTVTDGRGRAASGPVEPAPGFGDPGALAERLLSAGARSAVITLGARGCVLAEAGAAGGPNRVASLPAHRVPVVDTTGAGDAFVGALACELARGAGLAEAARFATAASALAVQGVGAQASYAVRAEIEGFLRARS